MKGYSPYEISLQVADIVNEGCSRLAYKPRTWGGYNGIAVSDCVGCNLFCCFCWVSDKRKPLRPQFWGKDSRKFTMQTPEQTYDQLKCWAIKHNLDKMRISSCEPTLNLEHTLKVMEYALLDGYRWVFETNGFLLDSIVLNHLLLHSKNVYMYFGLKGVNAENFYQQTGANPRFWQDQIDRLKMIAESKITLGIDVIPNFVNPEHLQKFFDVLWNINEVLPICVDFKPCVYFIHNAHRVKLYSTLHGLERYKPTKVALAWENIIAGEHLTPYARFRETDMAFEQGNVLHYERMRFVKVVNFQL